mmetsp:Transcript_11518/g.22252  ORF Transcript_11518/g.22252 Transcript_11518/m.22252 type:complete len:232 (-) Transcript_11518:351-1046(-)
MSVMSSYLQFSPTGSLMAALTASGSALRTSVVSCARVSVPCAFSATPRASGSEISSAALLSTGRSTSRNGSTSRGSGTRFTMLLMITLALRLVGSFLSFNPRNTTGTVTANAGVSTACTKTTLASFSTTSPIVAGFMIAFIISGTNGSTSLLPAVKASLVQASRAAAWTSFLMSVSCSSAGGKASTKHQEVSCGKATAIIANILSAQIFSSGFFLLPRDAIRMGATRRTAY